jgi:hypothetical protein
LKTEKIVTRPVIVLDRFPSQSGLDVRSPDPEILAWVEAMPPDERLKVMHAMTFAFPAVEERSRVVARIDAVLARLEPSAEEHANIVVRAGLCKPLFLRGPKWFMKPGRFSRPCSLIFV